MAWRRRCVWLRLLIVTCAAEEFSCSLVSVVLSSRGRPIDLEPPFSPFHHSYDVTLDFSMATFSVNVRPDTSCEDEGVPKEPTTVGIGSSVTLTFYATHAESRKRQAYVLHVQRLLGSETSLQNLEVEHGKLTPFPFSPEVRIYRVMLDLEMDLVNVRYRLRDNEQRLRVAAKPEEMLGGPQRRLGAVDAQIVSGEEMLGGSQRLLGAVLEREEALHTMSGEVQYVDSSSSFMLDVGYSREITLTIQCADPTQASIGTYTLKVERGNCPEQRPYLDPLKRTCVNFCPEGFYRNDLDHRCSRCNTNCQVCTGLLHCKMCLPDDVQYAYVIQPDGKCAAQTNHIYARYKWWCAGFGLLLLFLASFGCAGICTWCHSGVGRSGGNKPDRRRYFEDDLEEDKQLLQFPPGRRLAGY